MALAGWPCPRCQAPLAAGGCPRCAALDRPGPQPWNGGLTAPAEPPLEAGLGEPDDADGWRLRPADPRDREQVLAWCRARGLWPDWAQRDAPADQRAEQLEAVVWRLLDRVEELEERLARAAVGSLWQECRDVAALAVALERRVDQLEIGHGGHAGPGAGPRLAEWTREGAGG